MLEVIHGIEPAVAERLVAFATEWNATAITPYRCGVTRRHRKRATWWQRHGDQSVLAVFVGIIVFTGVAPPKG